VSTSFDRERGGANRASGSFQWYLAVLLRAHAISGSRTVLDQVVLTLRETWGGDLR
jgi:hypothetical protein